MEKKELKKELFEKYNWDRFFTEKVKEDVWEWVEDKLDKAREEGRREVYEAIVFDENIPHDITTFVAANLWKNMRDKAKEELSKLTTK